LRAAEAHAAVRAFLHAASADGLRCVAIVTGRGAGPEGGVLRRELPHWLEAPELGRLLLGAAQPEAARGGAVHLLLRRRAGRAAAAQGRR
ncbi:Smr/MutS family protein, partial [Caldovatus aquaticus]